MNFVPIGEMPSVEFWQKSKQKLEETGLNEMYVRFELMGRIYWYTMIRQAHMATATERRRKAYLRTIKTIERIQEKNEQTTT